MTDSKEVMRREYARVVDRLGEVDPCSNPALYKELLEFINSLYAMSGLQFDDYVERRKIETKLERDAILAEPIPEPIPEVEEPKADPVPAPDPAPAPEPEPEPEPEDKTYSKEEVRAALAESRNKGVDVPALLKEFGYSNFSAVPAGKYSEIMTKLAKKKKEKN